MNQMPVVDPEIEFPKVEKMLFKQVWSHVRLTGVTFEEALSEAHYAFMRSCYDYDPEKGKSFSTWCYYWVWCHFKNLSMAHATSPIKYVELDEAVMKAAPPAKSPSLEMVEEFGVDAKMIIQLLLETPQELLEGAPVSPKQLKSRVLGYLEKRGRDRAALNAITNEMEQKFREAWAA